jgi:hypothetical protein
MIRFSDMLLVILVMLFVAPVFGQQMPGLLENITSESSKAYMEQYCKTLNLVCVVVGSGLTVNSFSSVVPSPKCPEGYSAVFRSSGQPACAKEIIEPQ